MLLAYPSAIVATRNSQPIESIAAGERRSVACYWWFRVPRRRGLACGSVRRRGRAGARGAGTRNQPQLKEDVPDSFQTESSRGCEWTSAPQRSLLRATSRPPVATPRWRAPAFPPGWGHSFFRWTNILWIIQTAPAGAHDSNGRIGKEGRRNGQK